MDIFQRENLYLVRSPQFVDGLVKDVGGNESIVVTKGVDASVVLDKGNGGHSSN